MPVEASRIAYNAFSEACTRIESKLTTNALKRQVSRL